MGAIMCVCCGHPRVSCCEAAKHSLEKRAAEIEARGERLEAMMDDFERLARSASAGMAVTVTRRGAAVATAVVDAVASDIKSTAHCEGTAA
jgi:hypothetical protein